jgi:hypothetical protein
MLLATPSGRQRRGGYQPHASIPGSNLMDDGRRSVCRMIVKDNNFKRYNHATPGREIRDTAGNAPAVGGSIDLSASSKDQPILRIEPYEVNFLGQVVPLPCTDVRNTLYLFIIFIFNIIYC